MSYETFILLSAALVVVLLAAGVLGWRARRRRHRDLVAPRSPEGFEAVLDAPILYVATTTAGDPYDRVAVHGLGFRARGRVAVGPAGVVLDLPGTAVLVPTTDLLGVERATWTIDRVVEPGGLLKVTWRLGARDLDTYLRVTGDDAPVLAAIRDIQPHPTASGAAA
ncbi:PH-like domain-containing protein [Agrococcus sp. SGAir0287]|uniref:PH-like domain-containing protein n=1 Tax=Agrococcus sp. SGAir0287 TaxID=2070347 RepID=UPI0010CCB36E|nr:hypothetical protein [Agrococcus sp. SGAir0287]QCR19312.1 hypothetical protein C1N71_07625 [Agrococcus sp. SGAir0287]